MKYKRIQTRGKAPRMSKYHSKKVEYDGIEFASQREAVRYAELRLLEKGGHIKDLQMQVRFELIPAQYEIVETGEYYKRGSKKGQPKTKQVCVEKSVGYKADFVYQQDGKKVVEDAKGMRTTDYIIKRKLMLWVHGIRVKEV